MQKARLAPLQSVSRLTIRLPKQKEKLLPEARLNRRLRLARSAPPRRKLQPRQVPVGLGKSQKETRTTGSKSKKKRKKRFYRMSSQLANQL
jgi:hypothetical protein